MFKHYIFCRYNVGLYSDNPYKIDNPDEWMVKRIPKFRRMLESMRAQTSYNFTLIVFIDSNTPQKHKDAIYKHLSQPFKVWFIHHRGGDLLNLGQEHVKDVKEKWLITSRIDNDDVYLPEFVDTIQNAFCEKEEILDVRGYQIDEATQDKHATGRNKCNSPFITLVEPSKDAKTVLSGFHADMFQKYSARMACEEPMYIQYIHDHNIANKLSGKIYE